MKLSRLVVCVGGLLTAAVVGCGDDTAVVGGAGGTAAVTGSAASTSKASGSVTHASVASGEGGSGGGVPLVPCNPVTGAECGAGEACDNDGNGGYGCYPPPNDGQLCDTCDDDTIFCANGLTCDVDGSGKCLRFCCTDADCDGTAGSCNVDITGGAVGLCIAVDAGTGGAGGGGGTYAPICTGIPATAPSNGSCYTP